MRKLLNRVKGKSKEPRSTESPSGIVTASTRGFPDSSSSSLPSLSRSFDSEATARLAITGTEIRAGKDVNITNIGNLTVHEYTLESQLSELAKLKASLNPIDSAAYDAYASAADQRSQCFEGTRVQLLMDIESWIQKEDTQARIYILDGVAGIGKSTVAQTIAIWAAKSGILGATFFFSRNEDQRKTAKHFFSTIAFHLALTNEAFAQKLTEILKDHPDAAQKSLSQQFTVLVLRPLQELSSAMEAPILIVVDALDECDVDEARTVLTLLTQTINNTPQLRLFITTRPEWHIRDVLNQEKNHDIFRLHEIEDYIVKSDIRLYLDHYLSAERIQHLVPGIRPPWQPTEKERDMLYGVCGTLFILAATATKFILDSKRSDPKRQISRLLEGVSPENFSGSKRTDTMDKFYLHIIRSALPDDLDEDDDWFDDYQTVVGSIVVLQDPLHCVALAALLDVTPTYIERTLRHLHSLVAPVGPELVYQVHHKSFPDFITNEERIRKATKTMPSDDAINHHSFRVDERTHHTFMTKRCLRVMNMHLKRNMLELDSEDQYKEGQELLEIIQNTEVLPELVYACLHWASHLAWGNLDSDIQRDLDHWASHHILSWLESLIIIGKMDSAYASLRKAHGVITNVPDWLGGCNISVLLDDVTRIIQRDGEILKLSPMHLYLSSLPFAPPESALCKQYPSRDGITIKSGIDQRWSPAIATLVGHSRYVEFVAFSPDGLRLASASNDYTIRLWDGKTGSLLSILEGHRAVLKSVEFIDNGSRILSFPKDRMETARLWDAKTGTPLATLSGHSDWTTCFVTTTDGSKFASGSYDRCIRLWDGKTGANICILEGHSSKIASLAFTRDASRLASASEDCTIRLWDVERGVCLSVQRGHSDWLTSIAFNHDETLLASASRDKTIRLWDGATGSHISTLTGHLKEIISVRFTPGTSQLLSSSGDKTIRLWDCMNPGSSPVILPVYDHVCYGRADIIIFSDDGLKLLTVSHPNRPQVLLWDCRNGTLIAELNGHSGRITSAVFNRDGSKIATGSGDKTVRLWDGHHGTNTAVFRGHSQGVESVAFSSDGLRVASSGLDNTVRLWDGKAETSDSTGGPDRHSNWAHFVRFIDQRLVTASWDGLIHLLDYEANQHTTLPEDHPHQPYPVAVTGDGLRLASATYREVWLWDTETQVCIATLTGHSALVSSVEFSKPGTKLATGSEDGALYLWDGRTGARLSSLAGHSGSIMALAFSNDGSRLASASKDKTIMLWDSESGNHIATLTGHSGSLKSVIFSANGSRLASTSYDWTIRLWDGISGVHDDNALLKGHQQTVNSAEFSKDGASLVSTSEDGSLRIWDTQSNQCTATIQNSAYHIRLASLFPNKSEASQSARLLMLVHRHQPNISGLVLASVWMDGTWSTSPICWFPPQFAVVSFTLNDNSSLAAVGCKNGRVLIFDLSHYL